MLEYSVNEFLDKLSSKAPVPGGGSVSAVLGALTCALGNMVCNLTIGKKKYSEYDDNNKRIANELIQVQDEFKKLYQEDIDAFEKLVVSYKLPGYTEEQKKYKVSTMKPLLLAAINVPMCVMENCIVALELIDELSEHSSALAISDIGVSASCARACLESAILNIFINTASLEDRQQAEQINQRAKNILDKGIEISSKVYNKISLCLRSE